MLVTVLGYALLDFVSNDGKAVKGVNLFYGYETQGVVGLKTDKVFLSSDKVSLKDIKEGAVITLVFDNRGKVLSVSL